MKRKGTCENCGTAVNVRGVHEREWVHYHGSVFCMEKYATVDGVHYIDIPGSNDESPRA